MQVSQPGGDHCQLLHFSFGHGLASLHFSFQGVDVVDGLLVAVKDALELGERRGHLLPLILAQDVELLFEVLVEGLGFLEVLVLQRHDRIPVLFFHSRQSALVRFLQPGHLVPLLLLQLDHPDSQSGKGYNTEG